MNNSNVVEKGDVVYRAIRSEYGTAIYAEYKERNVGVVYANIDLEEYIDAKIEEIHKIYESFKEIEHFETVALYKALLEF